MKSDVFLYIAIVILVILCAGDPDLLGAFIQRVTGECG